MPTLLARRSRRSFHKTHPISWPEPRMAISMWSGSARSWSGQASPRFQLRQGMTKAGPHDVAIAYCQGTPLRNEIDARDPSRVEEATQKAAEALAQRFGSG